MVGERGEGERFWNGAQWKAAKGSPVLVLDTWAVKRKIMYLLTKSKKLQRACFIHMEFWGWVGGGGVAGRGGRWIGRLLLPSPVNPPSGAARVETATTSPHLVSPRYNKYKIVFYTCDNIAQNFWQLHASPCNISCPGSSILHLPLVTDWQTHWLPL